MSTILSYNNEYHLSYPRLYVYLVHEYRNNDTDNIT